MYSLSKQQVYSFEDVPFTFQNQHGANVKEGNQDYFFLVVWDLGFLSKSL